MKRAKRNFIGAAILMALCCVATPLTAPAGDDWLPVPPEDLSLKDNPKGPGTDAMILYRESVVNATESWDTEYVRIKVFTQKGVSEADLEIPFEKGQSDIKDLRARTIEPDGRIINFEGKPYDKAVVKTGGLRMMAKVFTMPQVTPGCIIEYKYKEQYDPHYYVNLRWIVQGRMYTRYARFSIIPPKYANAPQMLVRRSGLATRASPEKQPDGSYRLEVRDLPGIEEEELMPPAEALRARVEFFYRDRNAPHDESTEDFWNRTGKAWSGYVDEFVNKKNVLEAELARIVSPNDSPEAKLRKIYARVQQIRDLSHEPRKTEKEEKTENLKKNVNVEDLLKHGYGTGREMNYLFVGLTREAGFEASEVYLMPRTRGFFVPNEQDPRQLSADIVWVRAGGQEYYLDPAGQFFPFGMLPWYECATQGLRVKKQGADMVETPKPPSSEGTIVRHADLALDEEGAVAGKLQVDFTGQRAALRREENRNEDEAGRKKTLENEIHGWLPAGSTFEITSVVGWEKIGEPLRVEGTFKNASFGSPAGRRMLSPLTPFRAGQAKAFSPAHRTNPIFFHYPYEEVDEIVLRAPAGFRLETMPPTRHMQPGVVSYDISEAQQGDTVVVRRHLVVKAIQITLASYPILRDFFTSVESNDEGQVVFQNVESAKDN
jgi:hypothetical protein